MGQSLGSQESQGCADRRGGLHGLESLLWRTRFRHDSREIEVATEETREAKQAFPRRDGGTTHKLPERLAFGTQTLVTDALLFYKGRAPEPWKSWPLSFTC